MKEYSRKKQYLLESLVSLKRENLSLLVNYPKKIFHKVMILEIKALMLFQIKNLKNHKYKCKPKVLSFTQKKWVFKFILLFLNLKILND